MRPILARLRLALFCCTVVAFSTGAPTAGAQGMIVAPRPPCPPPVLCAGGACPVQPCVWSMGPVVVRTSSQVHAELTDRVVHYEVTETFANRGPRLGEADYLFPLPAGAAFQDLALSINGELVRGEVLDAMQARSVYEEIVRKQRDPALVEYMGAGLLRARIFPIAAGEEKTVVVRYQTVAPREGDALRIDYAGPSGLHERQVWVRPINQRNTYIGADDAPSDAGSSYSFTLTYHSRDGYGTPYSPTSSLTTERAGDDRRVRIEGVARDITILLPVPRSTGLAVSMLPYAPGDGPGFALITLTPPVLTGHSTPRDVTFVLDVSGSMSGHKIEQARAAGRDLLATLTPQDRFRLIDFSTDVRTFRDDFEFATPDHVREADRYLDELEAQGATNIDGALSAALKPPASDDEGQEEHGEGNPRGARVSGTSGRLPLVLFITDGEPTIGERSPEVLVNRAVAQLGNARLFTFGLGADVNTSLLEQLALRGRGTAQFVRPDESVERAVSLVAHRLTDPVVTDLAVHTDGVRLTQVLPATMVDLFAGQDLVLLARYLDSGTTRLRFTGRTAAGLVSWESTVTFPARERANPFVARLWATQRVGYLEAQRHASGGSAELDAELKELGERYGIPTEFTSYLVQEQTVAMGPQGFGGAGGVARDRNGPSPQLESQVVTGVATAPMASLNAAKVAAEQRGATTLAMADSIATTRAGSRASAMRRAGDRTFVLRDSVWTDTRYQAGGRVIRVQPFSPAYFALLQAVPELRDAFALSDRVLMAGRQMSIEVTPDGSVQLADAQVDAVRKAW